MTSLIFCLIFIQVAIFFVSGIALAASLYFSLRQRQTVAARVPVRPRPRRPFQTRLAEQME